MDQMDQSQKFKIVRCMNLEVCKMEMEKGIANASIGDTFFDFCFSHFIGEMMYKSLKGTSFYCLEKFK